jgi:hypothetical protein
MTTRLAAVLPALALLVLLGGCGDGTPPRVEVHPVKGKVLVGGKPASGALVTLVPINSTDANALRPQAVVGDDGGFVLGTYSLVDGVPPGDYVVLVVWSGPKKGKGSGSPHSFAADAGAAVDQPRDVLNGRFSDPATSKLRVKIDSTTTELQPFKL